MEKTLGMRGLKKIIYILSPLISWREQHLMASWPKPWERQPSVAEGRLRGCAWSSPGFTKSCRLIRKNTFPSLESFTAEEWSTSGHIISLSLNTLLWHFPGRDGRVWSVLSAGCSAWGTLQLSSVLWNGTEMQTTWEANYFMENIGNHCTKLINSF